MRFVGQIIGLILVFMGLSLQFVGRIGSLLETLGNRFEPAIMP